MTKTKNISATSRTMKTRKINYEIEQYVNRTLSRPEKPMNSKQEATASPLSQEKEKSECETS